MPDLRKENERFDFNKSSATPDGVFVEGIDDCFIRFAKCCSPLPGDKIIGFITRGHGVTIHKRDCKNIVSNENDSEFRNRLLSSSWAKDVSSDFEATLQINSCDREELLSDITRKINAMNLKITSLNSKISNDKALIFITITIKNLEQIKYVINNLLRVDGVLSVQRV